MTTARLSTRRLMQDLGLRRTTPDMLTIRRQRSGKGFAYLQGNHRLRDADLLRRLSKLAVPPAYEDVLFSHDPRSHLQAVGRDQAGRAQYRYHPEWEKVREMRKARRLARLVSVLPKIRRAVGQHLAKAEPTREYALAAAVALVAETAIRAGSEAYLRQRGTRGAATLLKSNVALNGQRITLSFLAKGGQRIRKEFKSARLVKALQVLMTLQGPRLFQFRDEETVRMIRRRDINTFLCEIAGAKLSLKDFRTLVGCGLALQQLATEVPERSARLRRRQILNVMRGVAEQLANTPAVCRKSYVHAAIVTAFETGQLAKVKTKSNAPPSQREKLLAQVLEGVAA